MRCVCTKRPFDRPVRTASCRTRALAHEVAARFYAARGFEKIAHACLRDARYCYLQWGAHGKVKQLDERYPHLHDETPAGSGAVTIGAPVAQLDVETAIKASQAVSGEIVLENLIKTLMVIAVEHAGAERGLLILPRGDQLWVEAEAATAVDTVRSQPPTGACCALGTPAVDIAICHPDPGAGDFG